MKEVIPEILTGFKYISLLGGGWIAKVFITKWFGKTKEEAEIVLNWEQIHEKRYESLLKEIKELKGKVVELIKQNDIKDKIIIDNKKLLEKWEFNCVKMESIIEQQKLTINKLMSELDK